MKRSGFLQIRRSAEMERSGFLQTLEAISKPAKTVTPEKTDVRNSLKILDSGFFRNDEEGVLQLALLTKIVAFL